MRGRSFTALTGRTLTTRTGAQSPFGTSPRCSRHVGLIEAVFELAFVPSELIFRAEGHAFPVGTQRFHHAGASAIASRGSRSCCRLKMPKLIAPVINPQTKNATNVRHNLEVPTYPNSGCRTRTRDTTTTHAPIPPSYHGPNSALGQNLHSRELSPTYRVSVIRHATAGLATAPSSTFRKPLDSLHIGN